MKVLDGELLSGAKLFDVLLDDGLGFFQSRAVGLVLAGEGRDCGGQFFDVFIEPVLQVAEDVFDGFGVGGFRELIEGVFGGHRGRGVMG